MKFFAQLRDRRVVQIVASYAAAAWIGLEVVDQLVDREILPDWTYLILLVWFLGGFVASAVVGWFHGERGDQRVTRPEVALLSLVVIGTLGATLATVRDYRQSQQIAGVIDAATGLDARRLAVLYFEDRDPDGELSYLADGLTEDLIDELATVDGLDVVSRNGTAPFRGVDLEPDSIARILDAGTFVEGSVERRGSDVRIQVALVDSESGAEIERGSFSRPAASITDLREDMTEEVSRFLRTWLGEEVRLRARRSGTVNDAAWVLVQRAERARKNGQALLAEDDWDAANEAWDRSDELLVQAGEIGEGWAEPPVERARLKYERARLEDDPTRVDTMLGEALQFVEQGLQLEARNADALEIRGTIRYLRWLLALEPDHDRADALLDLAEKDLRTSTEIDPLQANAWNVLGHLYYQKDDIVEANLAARNAYEADAFLTAAPDILWRLWGTSYDLENRRQSLQWCEEGRTRFPDNSRFYECSLWNMTSGAEAPDPDRAWALLDQVLSRTPEHEQELLRLRMQVLVAASLAGKGLAEADVGLADSARTVLRNSLGNATVDPTRELLLNQAFVYALMEDNEEAVDRLQEYLSFNPERRAGFAEHGHWWWRELRRDPAFSRITGG